MQVSQEAVSLDRGMPKSRKTTVFLISLRRVRRGHTGRLPCGRSFHGGVIKSRATCNNSRGSSRATTQRRACAHISSMDNNHHQLHLHLQPFLKGHNGTSFSTNALHSSRSSTGRNSGTSISNELRMHNNTPDPSRQVTCRQHEHSYPRACSLASQGKKHA